jgi:hypothetical protein
MMRKALVFLAAATGVAFIAAALAGGFGPPHVFASSVAGIRGAGETGIQLQNLDRANPASVGVDFYRPDGGLQRTIELPPVAAAAAANIWLPGTDLPTGAYAAVAGADRPIAAIARTDWPTSLGAAIYSNPEPATDVVLPLAVRHYRGQSSVISIQNTDRSNGTTVDVDVLKVGLSNPILQASYPVPANSSISLDFDGDLRFEPLGEEFLGAVRVRSAANIAVQSFVDIATSDKAVYAFEGVPADRAANTLYAPLFRAKQYPRASDPNSGRLDTGVSVVNTSDDAVDVTLTYLGTLDATASQQCRGRTFTSPTVNIPAGSSYVFYQGNPAREGLPDNCFGSAVINATGPVLAIVNDAQNEGLTSAAYNAVTGGSTFTALPLYRREHAGGLSTGIQAMNLGGQSASVTIQFTKQNPDGSSTEVAGCGAPCTVQIAPNSSHTWWPPLVSALESNTFGSATIDSTQPLAVIVNDALVTGERDMATYNGLGVNP